MSNLTDLTSSVVDTTTDLLEKVSSPGSRAGSVVERAGKMTEQGVDKEVTALQMTKNSPNGQKYTAQDVDSYAKLYFDSKTKVVLTAQQTRALIKDQQDSTGDDSGFVPQT